MRTTVRFSALAAAFLAMALGLAAGLQRPHGAAAADQTVAWSVPTTSSVNITAGETVTWDWADAAPHSVSSVSGPATFDSGVQTGEDQTFAFTFAEPGTYTYRCNIHPDTMSGTVIVAASQATPAATATTAAPTATAGAQPTAAPGTTALAGAQTLTLTSAEEVPPITTTTTGSFQWKLDGQTLPFVLKANGPGLTMAHIHLGAKGANGPVVAFLFGPDQAGVSAIDRGATVTQADLIGPLAGDWAGFIEALNRGDLYVNVHSLEHPAGVVRGQIPAPGAPVPPVTGQGTLTTGASGDSGNTLLARGAILAGITLMGGATMAILTRRRRSSPR